MLTVFIVAGRVHPGESNSSWIMRGLLEMLTGPSPAAQALRDKYLFMVSLTLLFAFPARPSSLLAISDSQITSCSLHSCLEQKLQ